tara:strand:- start:2444 stop:3418 length:975 start_codon:yes stop_codon:yes gene_type:complete
VSLNSVWWLFIFALTLLIGLRHDVGGDWSNYLRMLDRVQYDSLRLMADPGYTAMNQLSLRLGWGIYGVNLICGFIFSLGLAIFCRNLPRPLLALAVAVPYLIIVVAMGYSRQGAALGLAMIGLVALTRQYKLRFFILIILATTIHKSAFLLLPIAALASTKNRFFIFISVGALSGFMYFIFLSSVYETLITNYIDAQIVSQGALVRLLMNAIPASILLLWSHRFKFNAVEEPLWKIFSYLSILLLGLLFVSNASTAMDRIGLYMLPIQLVVFSYLPEIFSKSRALSQWIVFGVISYYGLVLFVWLNFATHANLWLPYQSLLFKL